MTLATLLYWTDLLAVAVFAISGALAAAEQKLDVLAFILFGTITGVGGGTLPASVVNATTGATLFATSPQFTFAWSSRLQFLGVLYDLIVGSRQ